MSITTHFRNASIHEIAAEMDRRGKVIEELEAKIAALASPAPSGAEPVDDETYEIGKRDGYEDAIQDLDLATGGDGEFRGSTIPGETVDVPTMKRRIIERFTATAQKPENADWPDGKLFTFADEPGEHDPCYVVMPDGCMLPVNHHAGEGVDIARAKFIVAACNAALRAAAPQAVPAEDVAGLVERLSNTDAEESPHYANAHMERAAAALTSLSAERDALKCERDDALDDAKFAERIAAKREVDANARAETAERKLEEHRKALEESRQLFADLTGGDAKSTGLTVQVLYARAVELERRIRALSERMEGQDGLWPNWGDSPNGFDGPGGAE